MKYADRVDSFCGEATDAWDIHVTAAQRKSEGQDIILLSVGNTDFETPEPVVEAAYNSLLRGRTNYPTISGELDLRQVIAERHSRKTGLQVSPDQVLVTLGAQHALYNVAQCLLDPGCEAIVPEPMYLTYPATINAAGGDIVRVASRAENDFHPTVEDIASAITDKTRAIFFATPNNPTGAVYPRKLLEGIAELCCEHDLWLVSDEVYGDITYGYEHISPAILPGMDSRAVTISSLSKSHAMAGWRLGWAIVPMELAGHLGRLILCGTYGSPTFIQDAAIVALQENPDGLADMKPTYEDRRLRVCGFLDKLPGLSCKPPQGGMFAMLDVRGTGLSAQEYATRLLDDQGVATLPTTPFGPSATGFLRLNLGVEDVLLDDAIERIAAFNGTLNFFTAK